MGEDEDKRDGTHKPKPIPIREAVGESGPRPPRRSDGVGNVLPSQAPGLRGQRERPEGPRGKGSSHKREGGGMRRPDRKGAESGREETRRSHLEPTPLEKLPSRSFEHAGCEWIVRLRGQTTTGAALDPGASLMHLVFYTAADPSVAYCDVLAPGSSLEGLAEVQLPDLLTRARSAPSPNESSG